MSLLSGVPLLQNTVLAQVLRYKVYKLSTLEVVSLKECEDILTLFEMSQESKLKVVWYFPLKCHGRSSLCAS